MCIVIDTNTLSRVFDRTNIEHEVYKPVLNWIQHGKGQIVFGGSKYIKELGPNYVKLFNLYKSQRKAVSVSNPEVDAEELVVTGKLQHPDFDDQHIVSLLRISKCKLICSWDSTAYSYFTHAVFFSPAYNKPKIYRDKRNSNLLNDHNIADICKPCTSTTKAQKVALGIL